MLNFMHREKEDLMYNKKSCNQVIYKNKLLQNQKVENFVFIVISSLYLFYLFFCLG